MTVIYPSDRKLFREGGKPRPLDRGEFFRAVDCVFDPHLRVELRDGTVYDSDTGHPHRWTRDEYHAALDCGILHDGDPFELLEGEIVFKMTQNRPHVSCVRIARRTLESAFGSEYLVDSQAPVGADPDSEPEPDLMVLPVDVEDYSTTPGTEKAILVVEVADTTIREDRGRKARIYAGSSVQDYWILNLRTRELEVYREPETDAEGKWRYRLRKDYAETESVAPLAAPNAQVHVADLLPPARSQH